MTKQYNKEEKEKKEKKEYITIDLGVLNGGLMKNKLDNQLDNQLEKNINSSGDTDSVSETLGSLFTESISDIFITNKTKMRQNQYYCIHMNEELIDFRLTKNKTVSHILYNYKNNEISKNKRQETSLFLEQFLKQLHHVSKDISAKKAEVFVQKGDK